VHIEGKFAVDLKPYMVMIKGILNDNMIYKFTNLDILNNGYRKRHSKSHFNACPWDVIPWEQRPEDWMELEEA